MQLEILHRTCNYVRTVGGNVNVDTLLSELRSHPIVVAELWSHFRSQPHPHRGTDRDEPCIGSYSSWVRNIYEFIWFS